MPAATTDIDATIDRIARQPFRAKFHLRARERAYVELRGMETVRAHAYDFVGKRLAPAEPRNDGKQTPWGGHPVFRAQHATATCCRSCLLKNHAIPKHPELTADERDYVVDVICRWVGRETAAAGRTPPA
jgi:hypothetical protein